MVYGLKSAIISSFLCIELVHFYFSKILVAIEVSAVIEGPSTVSFNDDG